MIRYAVLEIRRLLGQLLDRVPAYSRMPLSPSMNVMRLRHAAVFMNAGS
jgi:hypothetical protein